MAIKCFYHSADLDGYASGAIVKYKYPEAEMYPINYGDQFPWDEIKASDLVYMVDFSLQPFDPEMIYLAKGKGAHLCWIDHHSSAINEYNKWYHRQHTDALDYMFFEGIRDKSKAACELAWEYFFEDAPVPLGVKLLSLYDSWTYQGHELENMVLPFQMRLRMEDLNPKNWEIDPTVEARWRYIFEDPVPEEENPISIETLIEQGQLLLRYDDQQKKKYSKTYAFETEMPVRPIPEFQGIVDIPIKFRAIAVNLGHTNSKLFDSVWDENRHDIMVTFARRSDKLWNVGLYSTKPDVDCGEIAKNFGGGGHSGASGFQCKELPFAY